MSHSSPPSGPPKATVSHESGDVRVTVLADMTPAEASSLARSILACSAAAQAWRDAQLALAATAAGGLDS